jgi:opacity protein-like surface antigen
MEKRWVATMAAVAAVVSLSPVRAADLPQKAPAAEAPAASLWKGCYLGMEISGDIGSSQHVSADPATAGLPITPKFHDNGGSVGGGIGCNYEFHKWVFGVENDLLWKDARGSSYDQLPFNLGGVSHTNQNWLDTVRGRIGVVWDSSLMGYVTAGAAFTGIDVNICATLIGQCVSESHDRTGWVGGTGLEYAVIAGISVKFEYLHADFGSARYISTPIILSPTARIIPRDVGLKEDLFSIGMNWRFTALP